MLVSLLIRKGVFTFGPLWTLRSDLWSQVWPCNVEEEGGCPLTNWFNTDLKSGQLLRGNFYLQQAYMCPAVNSTNAGHRQRQIWGAPKGPMLFKTAESQQISETDLLLSNHNWHPLILNQYFLLFFLKWQKQLNLKWTSCVFLFSPSMALQKETTSFPQLAVWATCYCATHTGQTRRGNLISTLVKLFFSFFSESLNK